MKYLKLLTVISAIALCACQQKDDLKPQEPVLPQITVSELRTTEGGKAYLQVDGKPFPLIGAQIRLDALLNCDGKSLAAVEPYFQKAVEQEPRLRLYIVGKKFGVDADRYLTEFKTKLGEKLQCCSPIPPEQTADLLLRADVLVNMGNTVRNQMPSTVVEYISTGKPILNLSVDEECSTLGLMKRYTNGLQVFARDQYDPAIVNETVDFCRRTRGKDLSWQQVRKIFPEMELSRLTRYFVAILTKSDGACESQK